MSDAIDKSNLQCSQLVVVTTDSAPYTTGKKSGVVTLLRKKPVDHAESDLMHCHCIIHQKTLVACVLNMNDVIKIRFRLKSRKLKYQTFLIPKGKDRNVLIKNLGKKSIK